MNTICQTTVDLWNQGRRIRKSPNGWLSGNAVCCSKRGHKSDTRGRGGIVISGDTLSYSCFNCSYTCSYTTGKPLYPKFQKLLRWLGISGTQLNALKLESLRLQEVIDKDTLDKELDLTIKTIDLPDESIFLSGNEDKYAGHLEYLHTRGLTVNTFPFFVSDNFKFRNRIIIPFILHNAIIGYSARAIDDNKNRFIMRMEMPFVFGLHHVEPEHEWMILSEGLFDALSIKGLSVMHNEINEGQIDLINNLNKRIIVVPHLDEAGLRPTNNSLIQTAIDNNWNVSFPEWNYKDLNKAYIEYGELFVIKHILDKAISSETKILLQQKMCYNKFKTKDHGTY